MVFVVSVEVDIADLVAAGQDVDSVWWAMDSHILKFVADLIDVGLPFALAAGLLTHLDRVLVLIIVSEQRVHLKFIFEAHGESFTLVWEVNEDILLVLLCKLNEPSFELLGLRLFDALRYNYHALLERLLVDINTVVVEFDDTEGLESRVARAWHLHLWENSRLEGILSDIFVLCNQLDSAVVSGEATHVSQSARERSWCFDSGIMAIGKEGEGRLVSSLLLFIKLDAWLTEHIGLFLLEKSFIGEGNQNEGFPGHCLTVQINREILREVLNEVTSSDFLVALWKQVDRLEWHDTE